jgi:hypothetical protein
MSTPKSKAAHSSDAGKKRVIRRFSGTRAKGQEKSAQRAKLYLTIMALEKL